MDAIWVGEWRKRWGGGGELKENVTDDLLYVQVKEHVTKPGCLNKWTLVCKNFVSLDFMKPICKLFINPNDRDGFCSFFPPAIYIVGFEIVFM